MGFVAIFFCWLTVKAGAEVTCLDGDGSIVWTGGMVLS